MKKDNNAEIKNPVANPATLETPVENNSTKVAPSETEPTPEKKKEDNPEAKTMFDYDLLFSRPDEDLNSQPRAAVNAMRLAQENGQFFDNTGHIWSPTQVQPIKVEPVPMEPFQMMGIPELTIGAVPQIAPNSPVVPTPKRKVVKKQNPVYELPKEEYSRTNPHPRYFDVPGIPTKVKNVVQPPQREWFQYGIGSNAIPDKTPEVIEADRQAMNRRVKKTIRSWFTPSYYYVSGVDTNIDGTIKMPGLLR